MLTILKVIPDGRILPVNRPEFHMVRQALRYGVDNACLKVENLPQYAQACITLQIRLPYYT